MDLIRPMRFNIFAFMGRSRRPKAGSTKEQAILTLAQREVTPEHALEFDPITKGPIFAVVAILGLAIIAVPYMAYGKARARCLAAGESGADPPDL